MSKCVLSCAPHLYWHLSLKTKVLFCCWVRCAMSKYRHNTSTHGVSWGIAMYSGKLWFTPQFLLCQFLEGAGEGAQDVLQRGWTSCWHHLAAKTKLECLTPQARTLPCPVGWGITKQHLLEIIECKYQTKQRQKQRRYIRKCMKDFYLLSNVHVYIRMIWNTIWKASLDLSSRLTGKQILRHK